MKTKVTSIRMYPELWKQFKIYCVMNDLEVSEEICKLMAKKLKKEKEKIEQQRREYGLK